MYEWIQDFVKWGEGAATNAAGMAASLLPVFPSCRTVGWAEHVIAATARVFFKVPKSGKTLPRPTSLSAPRCSLLLHAQWHILSPLLPTTVAISSCLRGRGSSRAADSAGLHRKLGSAENGVSDSVWVPLLGRQGTSGGPDREKESTHQCCHYLWLNPTPHKGVALKVPHLWGS